MDETNPYAAPDAQVDESGDPGLDPYGGGELASRGSRLAARLVTGAVLFAPPLMMAPFADMEGTGVTVVSILLFIVLVGLTGLNIYWLYDNGQTIGKRALGIKIVRSDRASRASLARLLLIRGLSETVAATCCSLLYVVDVLFVFSDERQCIHDLVADTTVIVDGTAQGEETFAAELSRGATTPNRDRFEMGPSRGGAASSATGGTSDTDPSLYDSGGEGPGKGAVSTADEGSAEQKPPSVAEAAGGPEQSSEDNVLDLSDTSPTDISERDQGEPGADAGAPSSSTEGSEDASIDGGLDREEELESDDASFATDFELDETNSEEEADASFGEDEDEENDDDYQW